MSAAHSGPGWVSRPAPLFAGNNSVRPPGLQAHRPGVCGPWSAFLARSPRIRDWFSQAATVQGPGDTSFFLRPISAFPSDRLSSKRHKNHAKLTATSPTSRAPAARRRRGYYAEAGRVSRPVVSQLRLSRPSGALPPSDVRLDQSHASRRRLLHGKHPPSRGAVGHPMLSPMVSRVQPLRVGASAGARPPPGSARRAPHLLARYGWEGAPLPLSSWSVSRTRLGTLLAPASGRETDGQMEERTDGAGRLGALRSGRRSSAILMIPRLHARSLCGSTLRRSTR
jgi:hypothetical protein